MGQIEVVNAKRAFGWGAALVLLVWAAFGAIAPRAAAASVEQGPLAAQAPSLPETTFSLFCGNELKAASSEWNDGKVGLSVRRETTRYPEFGAVEWRWHIEQTGSNASPVLEQILAGDFVLPGLVGDTPVLHYLSVALHKRRMPLP